MLLFARASHSSLERKHIYNIFKLKMTNDDPSCFTEPILSVSQGKSDIICYHVHPLANKPWAKYSRTVLLRNIFHSGTTHWDQWYKNCHTSTQPKSNEASTYFSRSFVSPGVFTILLGRLAVCANFCLSFQSNHYLFALGVDRWFTHLLLTCHTYNICSRIIIHFPIRCGVRLFFLVKSAPDLS